MNSSPLIIVFSFAIYAVLHSFLASRTAKDWAKSRFGQKPFERSYRLFFNFIGVVTLIPVLALAAVLPDQPFYSVPMPWRLAFLAGLVVAVFILAAALQRTDALDFAGIKQLVEKPAALPLVTTGIYRWVRHPLYTGSMLFLWLIPEVSQNHFALNVAFTLYFVIGAIFEERKLERFFGKAYADYKKRTPMFIPFVRW
jgi:protein-S-isoprenylcysteine O-methyltransferase Ste14